MPKRSESTPGLERRDFSVSLEIREAEGESPVIAGYAAVFEQLSLNLGGFREKIAKGAFAKTISEADIRALLNHDPNFIFGRNRAGTLELEEDDKGLRISIDPPDTQWAKDQMVSLKRGDINQMSFQFRTVKDNWGEDADTGGMIRTLLEVQLIDVSLVTFPAYPQTLAIARGFGDHSWDTVFTALNHLGAGELRNTDLPVLYKIRDRISDLNQEAEPIRSDHSGNESEEGQSSRAAAPPYREIAAAKLDLLANEESK